MSFDDLKINDNVLRGVYGHGFEKPSQIQIDAIPIMLEGKDIVAQAQSGTGKTGAFSIGSLCRIEPSNNTIQCLIIVPTRELADQVYKVITDISSYTNITTLKVKNVPNFYLFHKNELKGNCSGADINKVKDLLSKI